MYILYYFMKNSIDYIQFNILTYILKIIAFINIKYKLIVSYFIQHLSHYYKDSLAKYHCFI